MANKMVPTTMAIAMVLRRYLGYRTTRVASVHVDHFGGAETAETTAGRDWSDAGVERRGESGCDAPS